MRYHKIMVMLVAICFSSSSLALFDAQVMAGKRSAKLSESGQSETLTGTELKAAVHLSPIPLVPVGFGLSVVTMDFPNDGDKITFSEFKGSEISLEVTAWSPISLGGLTPYGKLGYMVVGAYNRKNTVSVAGLSTDVDYVYKAKGTDIALGVKWTPLILVSALFEVDMRTQTLSVDEIKAGGSSITASDDLDYKGTSFLIGVEVGL